MSREPCGASHSSWRSSFGPGVLVGDGVLTSAAGGSLLLGLEGASEWLDRPVALRSVTLYLAARCISFCLSGSGGLAIVSPEV